MEQGAQQTVGGAAGDQFYITHCTTSDSVLNNPGYTVRAASSTDADVLDAAFHYPPYELPIDMWKDLPSAEDAPCRLARTENSDDGVWVVHSSYLAKDTVGRDRAYFSHLLLLPVANPLDVLQSWGAEDWAKSYPQGAEKNLSGNAPLPVGSLINDDALTAFLNESPLGSTELSVTVCPTRLRGSVSERRDLFARMLQAMLLFAAEENAARRRLYIHAEPGVIALLLYGAIRLLPPSVTDHLTFSTFEPYHRNFRDYKLAEIVGTYLGSADRWLDPDLGTTRGIALDTFDLEGKFRRSSPPLRIPLASSLPAGVSDLVELAVRNEWKLLPAVRRAIGPDPDGLAHAGKALTRERGLIRVDEELADINELIKLQEDKVAADDFLLHPRLGKVWKVVKKHLQRPEVRKSFHKVLAQPECLKELWEEAFEAIMKEDFRRWDLFWGTVREAVGTDESRKMLNGVIGHEKNEGRLARLSTEVRTRLRTACDEVGLFPPRTLLVPVGMDELELLLNTSPDYAGYSAFVLMAKDEMGWLTRILPSDRLQMRKRAREFLYSAPSATLTAYIRSARDYLDSNSYFLDVLFKPYSPPATKLMDKLLSISALEPGDWLKVCKSVRLTQDQWGEYLLEKDRLTNLLVGLRGDEGGKEIWDAYLSSLTQALVSPDLIEVQAGDDPQIIHEWEKNVHNHLRTAADRLTKIGVKLAPALPEGGVAKLFSANNLMKWVADPSSAERDGNEEVQHACTIYEIDPLHLILVAYRKGGYSQHDPGTEANALAPIVSLFRTCFPVDANFNTANRAVREAIRLTHECPEKNRGVFQSLLLHSCVPEIHYKALLEADWPEPLHPHTVARLNEWLSKRVKKNSPKYSAPVNTSAAPAVENPFAEQNNGGSSEAESAIPKGEGRSRRGSYTQRRRRKRGRFGIWLVVVVLCLGATAAVIVAAKKFHHSNNVPATQPDKPQTEPKNPPTKNVPSTEPKSSTPKGEPKDEKKPSSKKGEKKPEKDKPKSDVKKDEKKSDKDKPNKSDQ